MNAESRVSVRWSVLIPAALALLAVGAGAAYLGLRSDPAASRDDSMNMGGTRPSADVAAAPGATASPPPTVTVVTIAPEAVERAGITVTTVVAESGSTGLRAPGIVEPDAYRVVAVTPLVSGRVTGVTAELGQQVRQGQTLAQVFSPELAEAETRYVSVRAQLEAHALELARTEKLIEIGAASRQELERIHADHAAHLADVQSVRSRLELLGLAPAAIDALGPVQPMNATTDVPAPIAGVITERAANTGLNVDQSTKLFTVVDLSRVWVIADVFERDFARVRVGTPATVTTTAYPDLALQGRVSYIDPQVNPQTRTARVRIEVPNPRQELRFGMYAEALFDGGGTNATPSIRRGAVQHVGDRTVVYLVEPGEAGRFVERDVRLGPVAGDRVAVLAGLQPGDVVVGEGSFYVRAEVERLGLRASTPAPAAATPQDVRIEVGTAGFEPATVNLRAGAPARLTFVRTTDATCATEVVFPSLEIRRALPRNEPVLIEFTPAEAGDIAFVCGMSMVKGVVVAR